MRRGITYFVIGLLVGAAGGLLAGLLLAPASGAKTRRKLADQALRAAEAARSVAERAEHAAESIGGRVDRALHTDEEVAWRKVRELRQGVERYTQTQAG